MNIIKAIQQPFNGGQTEIKLKGTFMKTKLTILQRGALGPLLSTLCRSEAARKQIKSFTRPFLLSAAALTLQLAIVQTAQADFWTATGSMQIGRANHTATLLPDGKVLVAGGIGTNGISLAMASAELYDPSTGTWTATGPMNTARGFHTATLLPDGQVLVVGGYKNYKTALASAELYDPASGTWTNTGSLNTARWSHLVTLLPNGKVLVLGGIGASGYLTNAELYDPSSGTWTNTGSLHTARYQSTATLLSNGKVLVVGGDATGGNYLASAELYDPANGTWTTTGSLNTARDYHTATLLPNGNVLVAGGLALVVGGGGTSSELASAELYDPASGTWTTTGSLNTGRWSFTATLLSDGLVLAAGGYTTNSNDSASAELYDPAGGMWTSTGSLNTGRAVHTATLLPNGKVLVAGGYTSSGVTNSAELYGPPPLLIGHSGSTVTIFWQNVSGWTLQQNYNLATSAGWSASGGVTTANGTNYLNLTSPTRNLFFRLSNP
jgi:N-acetylneuraminic acid mutarotase